MSETVPMEPLSGDNALWRVALDRLGAEYMARQVQSVGRSHDYPDRPRYWIIDGAKVYASYADYCDD